jgi:hypothetical protein
MLALEKNRTEVGSEVSESENTGCTRAFRYVQPVFIPVFTASGGAADVRTQQHSAERLQSMVEVTEA